jgi:2-iminobutanoate/2-iminopropanoate deaminase
MKESQSMKKLIQTENAPHAVGPYSQGIAIESDKLIFTAGQIPFRPETNQMVNGGIEEQTERVIQNLKAILEAGGSGLDRVVKTTVFLKRMSDFQVMNQVYEKYFSDQPPARSTVEVSALPKGALIEMECIAVQ